MLFKLLFFSLGLGVSQATRESPKRESLFPTALWDPRKSVLLVFLSHMFRGLISVVQITRARVPEVRHQPLTPPREAPVWWNLSLLCVAIPALALPLPPILVWSFYPLLWRIVHLVFRSFSKGNALCNCSWECVHGRRWVQALPMLPSWTSFPSSVALLTPACFCIHCLPQDTATPF